MKSRKNKELFEGLHKQYKSMVMQLCLGYMKGEQELAKDLSQEVFMSVWNALDKFKAQSSYKTWIYRIAVNTCLKYIRDKKGKLNITNVEISEETKDEESNTTLQFDALYRAIGKLNEVDRLIIMMVLDESDYSFISDVMGISEGNLRVKIHRIKKTLKETLENEK